MTTYVELNNVHPAGTTTFAMWFGLNVLDNQLKKACFVLDPDALGGFGRKRAKFLGFPRSDDLTQDDIEPLAEH